MNRLALNVACGLAAAWMLAPAASVWAQEAGDAVEDAAGAAVDTADAAAEEAAEAMADAVETEAADGFASDVERVSYAIGLNIAESLKGAGFEIDSDVLTEAITTSFAGDELRMSEEQVMATLQQLEQQMQARQMEEMQQMMAEQQAAAAEQAEDNVAAAATFFDENGQKEGVQETDSGLQYQIIEAGDGPTPGPNDTVIAHYRGQFIDGTVFDSSFDRGEPVPFRLGTDPLIDGFVEGLQLLPVGSKGKLFIPGELAYGMNPRQGGPITPMATLIFDIEVLEAQSPEAPAPAKTELEPLGD